MNGGISVYIQTRNFGYNKTFIALFEDGRCNRSPRTHQMSEIQCVLKGSYYITVDGVTRLAKAGDIAVIAPFRIHSAKAAEPDSKLWICALANDFVSDFISNERVAYGTESVFTPSYALFEYVKENMVDTLETVASAENNNPLFYKVKAVAYSIFEAYTSAIPQHHTEVKTYALASIMLYLNEHFRERVTRKSVAAAVGYSPHYVSHCIESLPDMSLRKLVNSLRIEYAKKLLVSTDRSVIDIALDSGFLNERSFYRVFAEIDGSSPNSYRKTVKGAAR